MNRRNFIKTIVGTAAILWLTRVREIKAPEPEEVRDVIVAITGDSPLLTENDLLFRVNYVNAQGQEKQILAPFWSPGVPMEVGDTILIATLKKGDTILSVDVT